MLLTAVRRVVAGSGFAGPGAEQNPLPGVDR